MISALIVNHNGAATLERCLASLSADPLDDLGGVETIVVDNASTDGSPDLVRGRFPAARLVPLAENVGFGAAVNRAAAEAEGEQLLLLNNDAWLTPGSLRTLAERLASDPRLAWVTPTLRYPDGRLQNVWAPDTGLLGEAIQKVRNPLARFAVSHRLLPRLLGGLGVKGWFTAACALLRRRAFEEVGGFDERFFLYFEDVDLGRRLRRAGWELVLEPAATAVHVSSGGAPGSASEVAYRRSQLLYYEKHRPAWEVRWLTAHLRRKYRRRSDEVGRRVLALLAEDRAEK